MAQRRLEDANIRALITADDAGGVHIDFQRMHGAKLSVLARQASRARSILEDARMLSTASAGDEVDSEADGGGLYPRSGKGHLGLGAAIVALGVYGWMGAGPAVGLVLLGLGAAIALAGGVARWGANEDAPAAPPEAHRE